MALQTALNLHLAVVHSLYYDQAMALQLTRLIGHWLKFSAFAAVLLLAAWTFGADQYRPGQTYFGRNQYIEYLAGELPLIFSAPHGGREIPEELPDREMGTFAFDTNTQELARAVADELHDRTGC